MNNEANSQDVRADAPNAGDTPQNVDATPRNDAPQVPAGNSERRSSRPLPEDALIILPTRNLVLFPGVVLPITIGRSKSRAAAQEAARLQKPIGVLLQTKPDIDDPRPEDLHWVGTTANVLRYVTGADGSHHLVAQGEERFRVLEFLDGYDFPVARVQRIPQVETSDPEIEARAMSLKQRAIEILRLLPQVPEEMVVALQNIDGPAQLADLVSGSDGRRRLKKSRRCWRRSIFAHVWTSCSTISRGASKCSSFRAKSTSAPRNRWNRRAASICCASACARSRKSLAMTTKAKPSSRSSKRRSPRPACRKKSRSRRARN